MSERRFPTGPVVGLSCAVLVVAGMFGAVLWKNADTAESAPSASASIEPWQESATPAAADSPPMKYLASIGVTNVEVRYVDLSQQPCQLKEVSSGTVTGCVMNTAPRVIYLTPAAQMLTEDRLEPLVAHELAHVYQLALDPNFLQVNAAVKAAFPGVSAPHEYLADCMALIKTGHTTGVYTDSCTAAQKKVGNEVWAGRVPS